MDKQSKKMAQTSRASFPFDVKTLNQQSTQLDSVNDEVSRQPYNQNIDMNEVASISSAGQVGKKYQTLNFDGHNLRMTINQDSKLNTSGF